MEAKWNARDLLYTEEGLVLPLTWDMYGLSSTFTLLSISVPFYLLNSKETFFELSLPRLATVE